MMSSTLEQLIHHRKRGELNEAERVGQMLLQAPTGNINDAIETLRQLGLVRRGQSQYDQALLLYDVALDLGADAAPPQTIARLHIHRAVALIRLSSFNHAEMALGVARSYWRDLDLVTRALLVSNEARLFRATGDTVRAHQCSMLARSLAEALDDPDQLARAYVDLARSYASVGATEEALEDAFQAVRIADPEHHTLVLTDAYTTIYVAYHTLRRYPDALTYATRAHEVARTFGSVHDAVNTGFNVALALADVQDLPKAFSALRGLYPKVKRLGLPATQGDYLHTLGQLHLASGNGKQVVAVVQRCMDIYRRLGRENEYRSAQFILAQGYADVGDVHQSIMIGKEIVAYYQTSDRNYESLLASTLEFLSRLEYERKRYREAYDHLQALTDLRMRLHSEMARRLASVLDIRHRIDQLERYSRTIEAENAEMRTQLASAALRLVQHASTRQRSPNVVNAEWRLFQMQFDRVHVGFVSQLAIRHPGLSTAERRVCVMLAASLSTKDIAAVLSCSTRTIEWHRANVRRKMGLRSTDNLASYLSRFTT